MDKKELLLNNFSILSKKPMENHEALKSLVIQLLQEDPQLVVRCWHELLINNVDQLEAYWEKEEYPYDSMGYWFIYDWLQNVIGEENFKYAVRDFARDKDLLDIIYTKTFFSQDYQIHATGEYAINYLLRNKEIQLADSILSAIYKNKTFSFYSKLWNDIIDRFNYLDPDNYYGGGFVSDDAYKQDEAIQNFCLEWVERIKDEEQKAAALTFVMRIF